MKNKHHWSIWFGKVPFFCWFPKLSYFNGGRYEKYGFIWFNRLLEFSRQKNDYTKYKKYSKEEFDKMVKLLDNDPYYK